MSFDLNFIIQTFFGALLGGAFTILGGIIQQKRSEKAKAEDDKKQLKFKILCDFEANKGAIGVNQNNNNNKKNEFGPEFIRALNKIPVVFYDSKNVMESYQNFLTKIDDHTRSEYLNESSKSPNQLLYDLAISMYDDLKMSKPDYKTFFTYLNV